MDWLFQKGAWVFGVPAVFGSVLFAIKFLLMLIGVDHHADVDVGMGDAGGGHHGGHSDSVGGKDITASLRRLSFQGIVVLLMVFGWVGLFLTRELSWNAWGGGATALAAGVLAMWSFTFLMSALGRLQASGNIDIERAVGQTGEVYVGVPSKGRGRGQVRLVVEERQRIYNAESSDREYPRSEKVVVVGVSGENTLIVGATS